MGRSSSGVKGITCDDSYVVGAEVVEEGCQVLVVTENGYGKRTNIEEYRLTHRGSKGVKTLNITDKNGSIVSLRSVKGDEDLMIITNTGIVIRISIEQVSLLSRNTQGVRLINLKNDQKVATANTIEHIEEETINE
jgi:DNA gyrase subunit A